MVSKRTVRHYDKDLSRIVQVKSFSEEFSKWSSQSLGNRFIEITSIQVARPTLCLYISSTVKLHPHTPSRPWTPRHLTHAPPPNSSGLLHPTPPHHLAVLCTVLVTIPWAGLPSLIEYHSIDKKLNWKVASFFLIIQSLTVVITIQLHLARNGLTSFIFITAWMSFVWILVP